ncbi:MAG: ABC transporter ATP-binding protein [Planctomycetota bacterium]
MTVAAIETHGLTKRFGGLVALDGVDLEVRDGSVFGFLGPNGAGKTTALRILTGLARPTAGKASILGCDVVQATNRVRSLIGFLPDVPGFYDWMRADEFLRFAGSLFGLKGSLLNERISALLDLAGLTGVRTRIGGFSRGMKQRLGIAQALVNAPRLLLLDEPTSALDPIGRKEVLEMIASLSGRCTVFFSTHILVDVERVCDTVAILNRGRVVARGSVGELKAKGGAHCFAVELESGGAELEQALTGRPWLRRIERSGESLRVHVLDVREAQRAIPAAIASLGGALRKFQLEEVSLEEVFVDVVADGAGP